VTETMEETQAGGDSMISHGNHTVTTSLAFITGILLGSVSSCWRC